MKVVHRDRGVAGLLKLFGINLGHTIHHKREKGTKRVITLNVLERANMADPFMNSNDPELKRLALNEYPSDLVFSEGAWEKPAGAFRKTKGPE